MACALFLLYKVYSIEIILEQLFSSVSVIVRDYFIFESVFFDIPRAIYRLLLLNK